MRSHQAKVGIEPALTALQAAALPLCHLAILRAGNGAQTRDLNLGKVALYQLSYSRFGRKLLVPRAGIEPARGHPHWILNPACLPVSPPRQRVEFLIQRLSLAPTDSPTE